MWVSYISLVPFRNVISIKYVGLHLQFQLAPGHVDPQKRSYHPICMSATGTIIPCHIDKERLAIKHRGQHAGNCWIEKNIVAAAGYSFWAMRCSSHNECCFYFVGKMTNSGIADNLYCTTYCFLVPHLTSYETNTDSTCTYRHCSY